MATISEEYSFSIDDFENPKVYKNPEAVAVLLTRLLLLEPGTIQSHPEMGVGLYSKYMYSVNGINVSNLKKDTQKQIVTYLPDYQSASVNVNQDKETIYITIEIDSTIYGFIYNSAAQTIVSKFTHLADL